MILGRCAFSGNINTKPQDIVEYECLVSYLFENGLDA